MSREKGPTPQPLRQNTEVLDSRPRVLLIFGQGPVIDAHTREKASVGPTKPGEETVNFWGDNLANAATILAEKTPLHRVIVMGGPTGDDPQKGLYYKPEAALVAGRIRGVDAGIEVASTNTLENIVNVLNEHPEIIAGTVEVSVLGSDFHIGRLKVLMDLFRIKYRHVFSAEAVMRFINQEELYQGERIGWEDWARANLLELEQQLDVVNDQKPMTPYAKGSYSNYKGVEGIGIWRRMQQEEVWRETLASGKVPEYWIGYLGRLDNIQKIRQILAARGPEFAVDIRTRLGVDIGERSGRRLKEQLQAVKRIPPDGSANWGEYLEKRIAEKWPTPQTLGKLSISGAQL